MSRRIAAGNLVGAGCAGARCAGRLSATMAYARSARRLVVEHPVHRRGVRQVRGQRDPAALCRGRGIARPPGSRSTSAAAPVVTPCRSRARAGACWAPISWPMLSAARDRARRRSAAHRRSRRWTRCRSAPAPATSWSPTASGTCPGRWLSCGVPSTRPAGSRRPARRCSCSRFRATRCPRRPLRSRRAVHLHAVFGPAAMFLDA